MLVRLESRGGSDVANVAALLRKGIGIEVQVELVAPGETAVETQIDSRQKPIRLIDRRAL